MCIRDSNKRVSRSAFSKMRIVTKEEEVVQPNVDIKQLLAFISPQEISTFISEYASTNPEFKGFLLHNIFQNFIKIHLFTSCLGILYHKFHALLEKNTEYVLTFKALRDNIKLKSRNEIGRAHV